MRLNATRRSVALTWMLTIGTVLTSVVASPVAQALPGVTIGVSDIGLSNIAWSRFSPDARFATASDGTSRYHVDLDSEIATQVPLANPSIFDGNFAYGVENGELRRVTIATGAADTIDLPAGLPFDLASVDGSTSDGRFILVRTLGFVNMQAIEHHVLYDTLTDSYVTSPTEGIDPSGRSTRNAILSPDGDHIRYQTYVGGRKVAEADLVVSSGERRSVTEPTGSELGVWSASFDLEWAVFGSSDEILTGNGSPTQRLYRQELATGTITQVNLRAPFQDITDVQALQNGRVLMLVRTTVDGFENYQLFVWSNLENPAVQITQSADGDLANATVQNVGSKFVVDPDGERVAFASRATNLVPGTVDDATRLYVIRLPAVDPSLPDPDPTPLIRMTLPPAEAPVPGGPAAEVGPGAPEDIGELVSNGLHNRNTALVFGPGSVPFHFDFRSRELVEIAIPARFVSRSSVVGSAGAVLYKQTVATGQIDRFEPEFPTIPDGQPGFAQWGVVSIDGVDDAGRYILFTARAGQEQRAFLFDTTTEGHVPWASDGLASAPFVPSSRLQTRGLRLTGDGSTVLVDEQLNVQFATADVLRWDVATGAVTSLERFTSDAGPRAVSSNLGWEVFLTATDPLDIGEGRYLPYRRNTETGEISLIDVDGLITTEVQIYDDGLTLLRAGRGGADPVNTTLYIWAPGDDRPTPVPTSPAGPTQDDEVYRLHYDEASEIVTFATRENLGIAVPGGAYAVYQIDLSESSPMCLGRPVTVDIGAGELPTDGDDVILGTNERDVIAAGDGNDIVCAGAGNDVINGGTGGDIILGEAGIDAILGAGDNDIIVGGQDNDLLLGGGGDDLVIGQYGTNIIAGGEGNDWLWGASGDDTIFGQDGNDVIVGADGIDNCFPGNGADTVDCESVTP